MEALQWSTANDDFTLKRKMLFGWKMTHHRTLQPGCGRINSAHVDEGYLEQVVKTRQYAAYPVASSHRGLM